jgi:hypothetical protein
MCRNAFEAAVVNCFPISDAFKIISNKFFRIIVTICQMTNDCFGPV